MVSYTLACSTELRSRSHCSHLQARMASFATGGSFLPLNKGKARAKLEKRKLPACRWACGGDLHLHETIVMYVSILTLLQL